MHSCPSGSSSELIKHDFHQQEVEKCQQCLGLWFERGELNDALSIADNDHEDIELERSLGDKLGTSERQCHVCDQSLICYQLMKEFEIEIDTCASCHGVWLDNDELEKVVHSPAVGQALLELNKPLTSALGSFKLCRKCQ